MDQDCSCDRRGSCPRVQLPRLRYGSSGTLLYIPWITNRVLGDHHAPVSCGPHDQAGTVYPCAWVHHDPRNRHSHCDHDSASGGIYLALLRGFEPRHYRRHPFPSMALHPYSFKRVDCCGNLCAVQPRVRACPGHSEHGQQSVFHALDCHSGCRGELSPVPADIG